MKRIPSLDGLRAVAILMVCLSHLAQTKGSPLHNCSSFGNLGVRVFFVISGFLITRLLLGEDARHGSISLKNFYFRRTLRIFPAMWFYMAVMLVLQAAGALALQPRDALHAFTYTVNYDQHRSWYIGHLWSLSVEEQFYLLWPMALFFGSRRTATQIAATFVFIGPLLRLVLILAVPGAPVHEWFPTTCDALATGCLLALVGLPKTLPAFPWAGSIAVLPVVLNSLQYHVPVSYRIYFTTIGQTIMNCCIAVTVDYLVRKPHSSAGRVLNARPLVWIGLISYSLYLWQQPFLNHDFAGWPTRFPVNLAAAVAAASLSYYFVETPVLNLRKRLVSASKAIIPSSAALPLLPETIGTGPSEA